MTYAFCAQIERNRQSAAKTRAETERLTGSNVTKRLDQTPMPTDEEMHELSVLFNSQLAKHYRVDESGFYKLFKEVLLHDRCSMPCGLLSTPSFCLSDDLFWMIAQPRWTSMGLNASRTLSSKSLSA